MIELLRMVVFHSHSVHSYVGLLEGKSEVAGIPERNIGKINGKHDALL